MGAKDGTPLPAIQVKLLPRTRAVVRDGIQYCAIFTGIDGVAYIDGFPPKATAVRVIEGLRTQVGFVDGAGIGPVDLEITLE